MPLCENMPSGTAVKPGDVLTAMNGKTMQVCTRQPLAPWVGFLLMHDKCIWGSLNHFPFPDTRKSVHVLILNPIFVFYSATNPFVSN